MCAECTAPHDANVSISMFSPNRLDRNVIYA